MRLNIYHDIFVCHAMGETSTIMNINNARGNFFISNVGGATLSGLLNLQFLSLLHK